MASPHEASAVLIKQVPGDQMMRMGLRKWIKYWNVAKVASNIPSYSTVDRETSQLHNCNNLSSFCRPLRSSLLVLCAPIGYSVLCEVLTVIHLLDMFIDSTAMTAILKQPGLAHQYPMPLIMTYRQQTICLASCLLPNYFIILFKSPFRVVFSISPRLKLHLTPTKHYWDLEKRILKGAR